MGKSLYVTTSADLATVEYDINDSLSRYPQMRQLTPDPEEPDDNYVWELVSSAVHKDRILWFWKRVD